MIFALPLQAAWPLILVNRRMPSFLAWRLTVPSFVNRLPYLSNFYCLPGKAEASFYRLDLGVEIVSRFLKAHLQ